MTQQQDFHAEVGQVIQAENVTQIHHDHGRPLTDQERKDLNDSVETLMQDYGEPAWHTWRFLHRAIGIGSIKDMRLGHKDSARAILDLMLERAALKKSSGQPPTNQTDQSGELAELVVQNSKLRAQLGKSKEETVRLRQQLESVEAASGKVSIQLSAAVYQADKSEKMLASAVERYRQSDAEIVTLKKRARNQQQLLAIFIFTTLVGSGTTYYYAEEAQAVQDQLTVCEFDGKSFSVGSVIDGPPGRECAIGNNGLAVWQPLAKNKRQKNGS